ncbi:MAG: hypothetical protein Q9218_000196 [Villophora microphyllina]
MPSIKFFRNCALAVPLLLSSVYAQTGPEAFAIFNSTGRLPDGCINGYTAGHDEYLYTVPYTYDEVLTIIGSFANITWNGINSTTLNGTDNTVGTARFYTSYGIPLVEIIKAYQKPSNGPYFEDHTLAPAYNPTANLSIYAAVDSFTVTPTCPGSTASALNFTIDFCSTNVSAAQAILHDSHVFDAATLQEFLGNETFTGCSIVNGTTTTSVSPDGTGYPIGTSTGTATGPTGTGSGSTDNGTSVGVGVGTGPTAPPAAFTGGATGPILSFGTVAAAVTVATFALFLV